MQIRNVIFGAMLLLISATIPIAFAEEANPIMDENTTQEVKAMVTPLGAEVRLLQLEKHITKNILVGAKVLEVIITNHPDQNVNESQNLLDQMEVLVTDVKNVDLNQDKNVLVEEFVSMKKQANDLAKQFKDTTALVLTEADRKQIKDEIKDLDKNVLKALNDEIRQTIRNHNARQMEKLLGEMGKKNPQLIKYIEDGNATLKEAKEFMIRTYEDLNEQEKQNFGAQVREQAIKRVVAEKQLLQHAKEKGMKKFLERDANKLNHLADWMKGRANDANANGFEERAKRLENMGDQLNHIANNIRGPQGPGPGSWED